MRNTHGTLLPAVLVIGLMSGCSDSLPTATPDTLDGDALFQSAAIESELAGLSKDGFSKNGYKGPADGLDGVVDGMYMGSTTYANDLVKVKWNKEWSRGMEEGWTDANGYPGAKKDEKWKGNFDGGSGELKWKRSQWYKVGTCATWSGELLSLWAGCEQQPDDASPTQAIAVVYLRIVSEFGDDLYFNAKLKKPEKPEKPKKPKKPKKG